MRSFPVVRAAVAVALALQSGCAAAPSPLAPVAPSAAPSPAETPARSAGRAEAPILIGWQTGPAGAALLLIGAHGRAEQLPLPVPPNGPVSAGPRGPLHFVSGPAAEPVLWTSDGPLAEARWTSRPLVPPLRLDEPLTWLCVGPGDPPVALAVQATDNLVHLVGSDGGLRRLPPDGLFLRPGGCAWTDAGHVLVPVDEARMLHGIAFAMFRVDDGASRLLDGTGGEQPAASDVSLAYVGRDGSGGNVVLVGPIPTPEGGLPPATIRLEPLGDAVLFRPVLSADGRRLAVVELGPGASPRRLLLYELLPDPTLVAEADVHGASDAGPVWVADPAMD